jgi:hypothetical protein
LPKKVHAPPLQAEQFPFAQAGADRTKEQRIERRPPGLRRPEERADFLGSQRINVGISGVWGRGDPSETRHRIGGDQAVIHRMVIGFLEGREDIVNRAPLESLRDRQSRIPREQERKAQATRWATPGRALTAVLDNANRLGAGLHAKEPVEVNEAVTVTFAFLDQHGKEQQEKVPGRVAWIKPWEKGFLIGVVWDQIVTSEKNPWLFLYLDEMLKETA